jgi:hypothetical protein
VEWPVGGQGTLESFLDEASQAEIGRHVVEVSATSVRTLGLKVRAFADFENEPIAAVEVQVNYSGSTPSGGTETKQKTFTFTKAEPGAQTWDPALIGKDAGYSYCWRVTYTDGTVTSWTNWTPGTPRTLNVPVRNPGKLELEVKLSTPLDPKLMRTLLHRYDVAVVATGARVEDELYPRSSQPGLVVDAREVALGKVTPGKRVVVLGAGKIGLTLAEALATRGHEVTLVEREKRIAGDVMPSFKWRHSQWIQELKIPTLTSTRVRAIGEGGVRAASDKGEERFLPADTVIPTGPRRPNQQLFHELEWMVDEVHGCGDALIPRGLTQAIHGGYWLGVRL